jgi:D-alanyl-lipoteichoic acid acyltransferase DltB (MBOAT superfamily)
MLFNSLSFLIFLPLVFAIYWLLSKGEKLVFQNLWLLAASYVFYGWWDYRFLALIFASTVVDYWVGLRIARSKEKKDRKGWLWLSIAFNLGLLGFFKYYNFFVESWVEAFASIGFQLDPWTIQIILPVGISFYTFQTMSYSLDIYRCKLQPTKDFIGFAAFVSFFPQLVAGPIERASNLLPQILQPRHFSYPQAVQGARLMLWGFFKKIVIADALAPAVNEIFANYADYSSWVLLLGAFYFTLQIYCDFSGYSDIAIGTAKLFGINLMTNFRFPYFSRSIGEFWRRWHISLSTWFRDYVYIPLGGSRVTRQSAIRNVFIVFLVSGLWHGANWTFVFWGLLHALLFIPSFVIGTNRQIYSTWQGGSPSKANMLDLLRILGLFSIIVLSWVFFRAVSIQEAFNYLGGIFSFTNKGNTFVNPYDYQVMTFEHWCIALLFLFEAALCFKLLHDTPRWLRWSAYAGALVFIVTAIQLNSSLPFIYFQF